MSTKIKEQKDLKSGLNKINDLPPLSEFVARNSLSDKELEIVKAFYIRLVRDQFKNLDVIDNLHINICEKNRSKSLYKEDSFPESLISVLSGLYLDNDDCNYLFKPSVREYWDGVGEYLRFAIAHQELQRNNP